MVWKIWEFHCMFLWQPNLRILQQVPIESSAYCLVRKTALFAPKRNGNLTLIFLWLERRTHYAEKLGEIMVR
ncbi:MAG: hypothetical protein CL610_19025 [Anaerolineaceae bacterium]|nr:hypothetical protein [Anaerolineaceae bacterium]